MNKKFLVIFLGFLLFTINLSLASSNWWNDSWNYRMSINVTENSGKNLVAYSIRIVLNSTVFDYSKANSSGYDIRFTNLSDDELPYYIENWNTSGNSIIWFKGNLGMSTTTTFYMYYGNPNATSKSNPFATFYEYDNFDSASINTTKWDIQDYELSNEITLSATVSNSSNQSLLINRQAGSSDHYVLLADTSYSDGLTDMWIEIKYYDNATNTSENLYLGINGVYLGNIKEAIGNNKNNYQYYIPVSWHNVDDMEAGGRWWRIGFWVGPDETKFFWGNETYESQVNTQVKNISNISLGDLNGGPSYGPGYFDDFTARHYVEPEPTYLFGSEETPPPPLEKILTVKLFGELDFENNINMMITAIVKDQNGKLVSNATLIVDIYSLESNSLWIFNEIMDETIFEGVYKWNKSATPKQKLPKGVYLARVKASYQSGPITIEIIEFHIDPPIGANSVGINDLALFVLVGTLIFVIMKRRPK